MSRRVMGLLVLVVGLSITSPARAQTPTLDGVQVVGDPVVGTGVAALISGSVDPATVTFKWCHAGEQPGKCASGGPAGFGPIYVPDAADVGSRLMVAATATIDTFTIVVKSAPTAPVAAPAPTPSPTPTPSPDTDPVAHTGPVARPDADGHAHTRRDPSGSGAHAGSDPCAGLRLDRDRSGGRSPRSGDDAGRRTARTSVPAAVPRRPHTRVPGRARGPRDAAERRGAVSRAGAVSLRGEELPDGPAALSPARAHPCPRTIPARRHPRRHPRGPSGLHRQVRADHDSSGRTTLAPRRVLDAGEHPGDHMPACMTDGPHRGGGERFP